MQSWLVEKFSKGMVATSPVCFGLILCPCKEFAGIYFLTPSGHLLPTLRSVSY